MPTSIFDASARDALIQRLHVLTPRATPRWGKMSAPRMVAHLIEGCRMATGELAVAPRSTPFAFWPVNSWLVRWMPFPKNVPTAPELIARSPGDWESDIVTLVEQIRKVGQRSPDGDWPPHPAFGQLSGADWGVLVHRHIDHHFRQFQI